MEFAADIGALGEKYLFWFLPFLFVLTVVVFFHELGHFLVARWCGVGVKVFSVGFGKEIFGFYDKHGTRWRFSWIPLGGYVKFIDDENEASVPDPEARAHMTPEDLKNSFHAKPLPHRAAVVAAGPIANFILAILIFAFMFCFIGQRTTLPVADAISPGGAAERAGFKPGDLVISIDGTKIKQFSDMQKIVSQSADEELTIVVKRGDQQIELKATPERKETKGPFGSTVRRALLGIQRSTKPDDWVLVRHDPLTSLWLGTTQTWYVITSTLGYLSDVVTGRESADQLGGPIRIAKVSGDVAKAGFLALINLAAILSVSIGLLNLFPIPMLDGGHLLYYAIEAIRGRPLSERAQEIGFRIGLAMVLMLMIFATWNDLIHVFA